MNVKSVCLEKLEDKKKLEYGIGLHFYGDVREENVCDLEYAR